MMATNSGLEDRLREDAPTEAAFQLARHAVKLTSEGRSPIAAIEELQGLLRRLSKQEESVDNQ